MPPLHFATTSGCFVFTLTVVFAAAFNFILIFCLSHLLASSLTLSPQQIHMSIAKIVYASGKSFKHIQCTS